jgi:NIPSNAP
MIVEVRKYKVKAGLRARFLQLFETRTRPLQRSFGMGVIGPFLDLEDPDSFVWLRTFPSIEERDRMKSALYDGPEWKDELEALAMPMLERFETTLTSMDGPADERAALQTLARPGPPIDQTRAIRTTIEESRP